METRVERIDEDDSAPCEDARHEFSERRAIRFAGRIGIAEGRGEFFGEGAFERGACLCGERLHGIAQKNFTDAMVGVVFLRGEFETCETFARVPVGMIYFR